MYKNLSDRYLGGARSTKAVYGIILITAALIGLQFHETDPLTLAAKTFFAALVIVLAEAYSEMLGEKIRRKHELSRRERREIIGDATVIASVALYPVVIFLLSAMGVFSVAVAFDICFVLAIVGLATFGYLASRAAGSAKYAAIWSASIAAIVGTAVILVKYMSGH